MSRWKSSALSPPASLLHEAFRAQPRPGCQRGGGSVRKKPWEKKRKVRERCLANADWSVCGCRTRWPRLASDALGYCPGEHSKICACTRPHILVHIFQSLCKNYCPSSCSVYLVYLLYDLWVQPERKTILKGKAIRSSVDVLGRCRNILMWKKIVSST